MSKRIPHLGVLGTLTGRLTPIDLTLTRDGVAWNLTGYTNPTVVVVDSMTKTETASPGTVTIQSPATSGIVRWAPSSNVNAVTGVYEARIYVTPSGGSPEPAGLFRFTIVEH